MYYYKIPEAKQKEPEFVKMYLQDAAKLTNLGKTEMLVLFELLRKMNPYETKFPNLIVLNPTDKENIATTVGLIGEHENGRPRKYDINKYLKDLEKHNIIRKLSTGYYIVICDLFTKVDWNKTYLMKEMQMRVKYNIHDKTFVTLVEAWEENKQEEIAP